jgi:hypothetical protein
MWLALLLALACAACGNGGRKARHLALEQLSRQAEQSCGSWAAYQRRVVSEGGDSTLSFAASEGACLLSSELKPFLSYYYDDPYRRDLMERSQRGDTVQAALKIGVAGAYADLLRQQWLAEDSLVRYVSLLTLKENWLFSIQTEGELHFDSLGRYARHRLHVETRVPMINSHFQTEIHGSAAYAP